MGHSTGRNHCLLTRRVVTRSERAPQLSKHERNARHNAGRDDSLLTMAAVPADRHGSPADASGASD